MRFSIKEIIKEEGNYAFLCKDLNQFKLCLDQVFNEGIILQKNGYIENYQSIVNNYISHLGDENICCLFKNIGHEIQFYSRDQKDSDGFDWTQWKLINYTQLLRDLKLNKILK
jgi:hypothetical protein